MSARAKAPTRGPNRFKQAEVSRCMRAVRDAGYDISRVEVAVDGKVSVVVAGAGDANQPAGNDLDNWMAKRDAHQA
jgi:hypothetical protein